MRKFACAFGVCVFAFLTPTYGQGFPGRTASLYLGVDANGTLTLTGSAFGGASVALDPAKLELVARPFGKATAPERAIRATFGRPESKRLPGDVQNVSMSVVLAGPPGPPGIYDVRIRARGAPSAPYQSRIWWPDESGSDRALVNLRKRLVGHAIYGFGGLAISCPPDWTTFYDARTPLRVRSVERERGRITWLATGNSASAPYVSGAAFIAFDPLRISLDRPPASVQALGSNRGRIGGPPGTCPEIELADWQVDTTFALHPPPPSVGATPRPLRAGMSRDEVVWTCGYPNEIGTRAALRRESTWTYGHIVMDEYHVTFRGDRVVSFTTR